MNESEGTQFNDTEYILCSGIWFNDQKEHVHQPRNIKEGFVVCGFRHHNCFQSANILSNGNREYIGLEKIQGFLTNNNIFVNREEGAKIAFKSGQIPKEKTKLFSEDIY